MQFESSLVAEIECVEQAPDGGTVRRNVRVGRGCLRVGKVVAAAASQRLQVPVPFDELNERNVVGVGVVDFASRAEWGDDQQRNAGAVAEESDGLDVTGVVVTAAFVKCNENCGAGPQIRMALQVVDQSFGKALKDIELRRSWMAIRRPAGFHDRNGSQSILRDVLV